MSFATSGSGLDSQIGALSLGGAPGSALAGGVGRQGGGRVAHTCLELMAQEAARYYSQQTAGPSPSAALQAVGMRVGEQLAERYSSEKPRLGDTLEVIKFICKEFWVAVFGKQVDNLRTNHRMPAGILCGALSQLGVVCTVEPEVKVCPACVFTIKVGL